MFKSILSLVLIAAIVTSNFSRLFIFAGFELNKEFIAAELCENRTMPELNCDGQCYLAKKIEQAKQKEKSNPLESKKGHFQEAFLSSNQVLLTPPLQDEITRSGKEVKFDLPSIKFSIFHPPKV